MPSQLNTFPGQMGLVGVAGVGGQGRQVRVPGVDPPNKPLELQHPLQGLRPVADGGVGPPAQLTHADPGFTSDLLDPDSRVAEHPRRLDDEPVDVAVRDQPAGQFGQAGQGQPGGKRARDPPRVGGAELGQIDPAVAQFAERQAEGGTAGPRPEPHPEHDRAGGRDAGHRHGVRPGDDHAGVPFPDQVAAAVRQDKVLTPHAGRQDRSPQAGHDTTQRRGRRPLGVSRVHATKLATSMADSFNAPAPTCGFIGP
jgi:hypothetical protein